MTTNSRLAIVAVAFLIVAPISSHAQKATIRYIYPAGGQRGTTVEATITGTALKGARDVRVVPEGVKATIKKVVSPGTVVILATIDRNAALGEHELRLVTPAGASNEFRFMVGQLPEIMRDPTNVDRSHPQRIASLPVLVNGQLLENTRNYYTFSARAGQTIVCAVQARSILPFIADAVPGWFDACLTLYDSRGKRLDSVDDFRNNPDPMLSCRVPADGEYMLEVKDIIDRGRADFVYRLQIGEIPFLTHIYPLGGRRGHTAQVAVHGVNLAASLVSLAVAKDAQPKLWVAADGSGLKTDVVPFATDDYPEVSETEPNDTPATANAITAPVVVNGRFDKPSDEDYFTIRAQAKQRLVMEVQAARLGSPADALLTLFGPTGRKIVESDDVVDLAEPLLMQQADPRIAYTFPAAGTYYLRMREVQRHGGDEYAYRLVVAPTSPDFSLIVTPDNPTVAKGDSTVLTVTASRNDLATGDIDLTVTDLPRGFTASPAVLTRGQSVALITVTAPADADDTLFAPTIRGVAKVADETIARTAVSTEKVMQAFSYTEYPRSREILCAALTASRGFSVEEAAPRAGELVVPMGGQAQLTVRAVRQPGYTGQITLRLAAQVPGVVVPPVTMDDNASEATVLINSTGKIPYEIRTNIVLTATLKGTAPAAPAPAPTAKPAPASGGKSSAAKNAAPKPPATPPAPTAVYITRTLAAIPIRIIVPAAPVTAAR